MPLRVRFLLYCFAVIAVLGTGILLQNLDIRYCHAEGKLDKDECIQASRSLKEVVSNGLGAAIVFSPILFPWSTSRARTSDITESASQTAQHDRLFRVAQLATVVFFFGVPFWLLGVAVADGSTKLVINVVGFGVAAAYIALFATVAILRRRDKEV